MITMIRIHIKNGEFDWHLHEIFVLTSGCSIAAWDCYHSSHSIYSCPVNHCIYQSFPHPFYPLLCSSLLFSVSFSRLANAVTEIPPHTDSFLTASHRSDPDLSPALALDDAIKQKAKIMSAYHMTYWDAEDRAAVERSAAQLAALSTTLKDQAFR